MMGISLILSLFRLIKGPTNADRTVALDVMTIVSIAIICMAAFLFNRIIYLDTALVYGLVSFIGVVTVARYMEGGL